LPGEADDQVVQQLCGERSSTTCSLRPRIRRRRGLVPCARRGRKMPAANRSQPRESPSPSLAPWTPMEGGTGRGRGQDEAPGSASLV